MVRANLKGVFRTYKTMSDGSRRSYWYHRKTNRRLPGEPGSVEFIAALAEAEHSVSKRHEGTLNGLIRAYSLSVEFSKLAPSTQAEYRRMLTKIETEFGSMPIEAANDPRARKILLDWRETIARSSGNREADNRLSVLSALLSWAVDRGHLSTNHLKGFRRLYHSDRSEMIWSPQHIAVFMRVAPLEMQRALILGLHTGLREADILSLAWSAYDGKHLTIRIGKNRRLSRTPPPVTIRCTSALCNMLDQMPRTSPLVLTTKTGRAFKKRWFITQWKKASALAGIVDLRFHDLRGTAITLLSEVGNNPQMISAVTGHSVKTIHTIIEKYLARTKYLSDAAMSAFENSPRTKFANQLQTSALAKNS